MKTRIALTLCISFLIMEIPNAGAQMPDERALKIIRKMDAGAEHYRDISHRIWEMAELGYQEHKSAALLKSELRGAGFQIRDNVAGIPTAFVASWGVGEPVIGILGEYDALPELSQEAVAEKRRRPEATHGHGCGHNLFGTASSFAAITVKEYMEESRGSGTVRFYGCPAEEGGGGKIYMVRAGVFSDCDIVLTWHPGDSNRASVGSNLANISAKFRFHGKAAHAGTAPDKGRSALDALALMNHAVELLREHVPGETRLHYIISNGGGAPNTVSPFAEAYYYARHPNMSTLDGIWARVVKCAEAGALATETRMEMEIVSSVYNFLPNDVLAKMLDRNLRIVGGVGYTDDERRFAEKLRETFSTEDAPSIGSQEQIREIETGLLYASADTGDVSWQVPTAQITTATYVPGTPGHSWQSTACTGMSIGQKGMLVAAKTLALTALDLFENPKQIDAALSIQGPGG